MRVVFLFFLLLNAAYFYLHSDLFSGQKGPAVLQSQKLPEGAKRLTLLRERDIGGVKTQTPVRQQVVADNQSMASEKTSISPENDKPKKIVCYSLGPFSKVASANRAAEAINVIGLTVKHRQATQRVARGYWVYLPSFNSYEAAKREFIKLQKKGIKDLFIMGKGEHKNAISLGLFNTYDAAKERFDQVKGMGLHARMETQYRENKQTWLDITAPSEKASNLAVLTTIAKKYPSASLSQQACK